MSAWSDDLVERVKAVVSSACVRPKNPEFKFKLTWEAGNHYAEVLKTYDLYLGTAIDANCDNPLGYGSKFWPANVLQSVFNLHPNWLWWKNLLTYCSNWSLNKLDNNMQKNNVNEAITIGNHKGATSQPLLLRHLILKDVSYGFGLTIPLSAVHSIQGALLALMNIMKQNTIDEQGRIIPKDRLTHDQSYAWGSGTSINSRVRIEDLLPCRFGTCIRWLVNYAVAARKKYPNRRIMGTKIDYKSAYCRCHLNWLTAIQTITQLPDKEIAIILLQLTFGGSPGPYEWGVISKSICNLANALLLDDNWNPHQLAAPTSVPTKQFLMMMSHLELDATW